MELQSALQLNFLELADAFNASFEGYAVLMRFDAAALESRCRAETWDLSSSFVARSESQVAGSLFISRRGRNARVAAMGVTPAHRRTGVGRAMMERCVADSRARGDARFLLEVLQSNHGALALYESVGFSRVRALLGYECAALPKAPQRAPDFAEIELSELAARVYAAGELDLPWQIDPATLANLTLPARAFALGDRAAALVADPGQGRVMLRAIVVAPHLRRAGHGSALLAQLGALFPGRTWTTSYVVPEGLGEEFFRAHGFTRSAHPIWEMVTSS